MPALEIWKAEDFPGGPVVGSLLANAGDMGSNPGPGVLHTWGAARPITTATELVLLGPLQRGKPPQWGAHVSQLESGPHSLPLEEAWEQKWRPKAVKNK